MPDQARGGAPLSDVEIVDVLSRAQFVVKAQYERLVVADRIVAGEPDLYRALVLECNEPGDAWSARCWLKQVFFRFDRPFTETRPEPLHVGGPFADVDSLEMWLGGIVSVPVSETEVRALRAHRPAA